MALMGENGSFNLRDIGTFIRDVGFPVVVAIFLLIQLPKLNDILVELRGTLLTVGTAITEQTKQLQAHRRMSEKHFSDDGGDGE